MRLEPRQTCILAGAGISFPEPAALPLAISLLEHLMRQLGNGYASKEDYLGILRLPPVSPRRPGEYLRFEHAFDRLALVDPYERFLREAYSNMEARPNGYHQWLAGMLKRGANVITPNFDLMIESALAEARPDIRILQSDHECREFLEESLQPSSGVLQKIHGSVTGKMEARFPSLIATRAKGPRYAAATRLMQGRTLVIVGYSGSDDYDIVPLLEARIQDGQSMIWIDHREGAPERIAPELLDPEKPRSAWARSCKDYVEIAGDTAAALAMVFGASEPSGLRCEAARTGSRPLPDLRVSDWERLSLLYGLLEERLYAGQTGLLAGAGQALKRAAAANDESRLISTIDRCFDHLCNLRPAYREIFGECDCSLERMASTLDRVERRPGDRLYFKVSLLSAWMLRERGEHAKSAALIDEMIAECVRIQHWPLLCQLPEWAVARYVEAEKLDRRDLFRRAGWDLVLWTEDLAPMVNLLYWVEDAGLLAADGAVMPFGYQEIHEELTFALRINQMFGNVSEERNALENLARLEWVWNRFDSYKEYKQRAAEVAQVLSRPVPRLEF